MGERNWRKHVGAVFLKIIAAHSALTAITPSASKPKNLIDNLFGGVGELPDAALLNRMVAQVDSLPHVVLSLTKKGSSSFTLTRGLRLFCKLLIVVFLFTEGFSSWSHAQSTPNLPSTLHNYSSPPLPAHFKHPGLVAVDNTPANNPTTDAGATLGRVLFYDVKLSINSTVSCGSCHQQSVGFSDSRRLSIGFDGEKTERHSMSLANVRYYGPNRFFWDERAIGLENQVLQPIQDPEEMGMDLSVLVLRLSNISYYPSLFEAAFGDSEITSERISRALAQYVRSILSYRSKYDVGLMNGFSNFTDEEEAGRLLFNSTQTFCGLCHEGSLQTLDQARNTGLDASIIDPGAGSAKFKSPSLRNIAVSAPYMHDGRFSTLAEVVDFYNSDIQNHPNLDNRLIRNGQTFKMNLNAAQRASLVTFMGTFTDEAMLNDPAFSDPFIDASPSIAPTEVLLPGGDN